MIHHWKFLGCCRCPLLSYYAIMSCKGRNRWLGRFAIPSTIIYLLLKGFVKNPSSNQPTNGNLGHLWYYVCDRKWACPEGRQMVDMNRQLDGAEHVPTDLTEGCFFWFTKCLPGTLSLDFECCPHFFRWTMGNSHVVVTPSAILFHVFCPHQRLRMTWNKR